MKELLLFIMLLISLSGCMYRHEDGRPDSQFIFTNDAGDHGNIALYNYDTKVLTERFHTVNASYVTPINGANKNGNNLYVTTSYVFPTLRKINLFTGTQEAEIIAWINADPSITFHGTDVIMSHSSYDPVVEEYRGYIRIYNEDLVLKDSVMESKVYMIYESIVIEDQLLLSVGLANRGYFIIVMNLHTLEIIDEMQLPGKCFQLFKLNDNELLGVYPEGVVTIEIEAMEIIKKQKHFLGVNDVALNQSDNLIYYLHTNAQPAPTEYTLYSFNLSSGVAAPVTTFGVPVTKPILFDKDEKVILTGGEGLKIFNRNGGLAAEIKSPSQTLHIFQR